MAAVEKGDVLLLHYENDEHVALITEIVAVPQQWGSKILFVVKETNYHHCKEGTRVIAMDDPAVKGIYRPA